MLVSFFADYTACTLPPIMPRVHDCQFKCWHVSFGRAVSRLGTCRQCLMPLAHALLAVQRSECVTKVFGNKDCMCIAFVFLFAMSPRAHSVRLNASPGDHMAHSGNVDDVGVAPLATAPIRALHLPAAPPRRSPAESHRHEGNAQGAEARAAPTQPGGLPHDAPETGTSLWAPQPPVPKPSGPRHRPAAPAPCRATPRPAW